MLGCGTEKMLLSRGINVGPVAAINSSQVSNGILLGGVKLHEPRLS